MKKIILLIVLLISVTVKAQLIKVDLQASGLTCSMCSNAINKALKTLDFIDKVIADIKSYTFNITFKPGVHADFDLIRKKVEDAGFSVSGFTATIHFSNVQVKEGQPIAVGNYTFLFSQLTRQSLNGAFPVKFIDRGFISAKEYKKYALPGQSAVPGIYHVTL